MENLLTVDEVAQVIRKSRQWVHMLYKQGKLKGKFITGKALMIDRESMIKYLEIRDGVSGDPVSDSKKAPGRGTRG